MSAIHHMSEPERQSWITLIADGFVFVWFWKAMAPGWSLIPDEMSRADIGGTYLKLIIVTIIYHAIISAFFALRSRSSGLESDERDAEINAKGTRVAYGVLNVGIAIILIAGVMGYAFELDIFPMLSIQTPVQFLFAITFISYVADLVRHGSILLQYSRS